MELFCGKNYWDRIFALIAMGEIVVLKTGSEPQPIEVEEIEELELV